MTQTKFKHIDCRREHGALLVTILDTHLSGDELAEALRKELLGAAEDQPASKWIIDFRRVQFFTSAGIRPLLTLHRRLQSSGARLVLCNLREEIAEVFHATRLLATPGSPPGPFEAAPDLEQALCRLRHHVTRLQDGLLVVGIGVKEMRGEELADDLGKELIQSWQASGSPHVVIEMTGVEIVTTPCMRSLLQLRHQVKEKGGLVALCDLTPQVADTFAVTRLIASNPETPSLFLSFPDVTAAVAGLAK
ncbi:MAG: STAS domain-containing protein [Gemmataceae bacterium]